LPPARRAPGRRAPAGWPSATRPYGSPTAGTTGYRRSTRSNRVGPGAPFRFEAVPPFGLAATLAVVTPTPLNRDPGLGFTVEFPGAIAG
jgi:hypothetical protein